jgi:hypothetical protein
MRSVDVDTLAGELAAIAPLRHYHHADGDLQFLDHSLGTWFAIAGFPGTTRDVSCHPVGEWRP